MEFTATFFSLLPPIIAIALALITKEVYLSLFIGIVSGALLVSGFQVLDATNVIFDTMGENLGDTWNIGILIFLVFLGMIVSLMNRAGGSKAYGAWANKKIHTKHGALYATFALGSFIFVDDYFNCLTVGNIMREVSDSFKISRAKLAYIIDSTAAPICIIAPISSWAAAVSGYTSGDGFTLFLSTIPYNLYALLTIVMVIHVIRNDFDFGKMEENENCAALGDVHFGLHDYQNNEEIPTSDKGKVLDLVLPVLFLIIACVTAMIYTGGFFEGVDFITAFTNCDASSALVLGSFFTLIFTFLLYIPRRIIRYQDFADCIPQGFKMMVPAIIILILAWTLGDLVSTKLEAGIFVSELLKHASISSAILPAILFIAAAALAFSTGTSWGTFGILIPIVTAIFAEGEPLLVICISSILAGAVCGDHISPISDTTIMASAGAQCNHINHVTTQTPYALIVAVSCVVGYLVAGFTKNVYITFIVALLTMVIVNKIVWKLKKRKR
ncbi:Na+/H+ antiporter NhaC family protein [Amedibacillus sp. YH-ame6]